jgi:hypothetical protein
MNKLLIIVPVIAVIASIELIIVLSQPNTPTNDITYYNTPKPNTTNHYGNSPTITPKPTQPQPSSGTQSTASTIK